MSETKEVIASRLSLQTPVGAVRMSARITPLGLLAVGGMVAAILLASAVVIKASRTR